ncbi:MAG: TIGR03960 family B12-binding radical SAM protein [Eubacterium sp.]|nr:TIGR03960 family B12-binding radical SAM protein [Eubacterium sp.]
MLMLSDEILMQVDKPARYIGNEINAVKKNADEVDIRFCMCFPDVYEIGMSHLGIQVIYGMLNEREDVWCERLYSPWGDLDKIMREKNIPLFSLESQTPVKEFDFLGITLQYEMCYTNILQILDLSKIALRAKDRAEDDPIVIGGGPCVYNPEPVAPFFDLFYIGEGETEYDRLLDLYKECKKNGLQRRDFLIKAGQIPGIYAPSLYEDTYNEDGTLKSFEPLYEELPKVIEKQVVTDFDSVYYPNKPVVPFIKATQDRVMLEIQRGCIRGCRFCQAGMIYRPNREKNVERLKKLSLEMIKNTGHEEISLVSLSTSDYKELEELIMFMIDDLKKLGVQLSFPSLRIDAFAIELMKKVKGINKSSLTFAPEAGSQRMRDVINKGLTKEDIIGGAGMAFDAGWNKVKLYFMLGLPTETDEDAREIPRLANDIAKRYYEIPKNQRNGKVNITMAASFFVPKPFTPFQWAAQYTSKEFLDRSHVLAEELKNQLNQKSISYHWHESDTAHLEGALARGDRRMADVIEEVYRQGEIFSAWGEFFSYERWEKAFEKCGLDMMFYTTRERDKDELFPWDFINAGVTKQFLWKEWERALNGEVTPNCRQRCSNCGSISYGGGVCYDKG